MKRVISILLLFLGFVGAVYAQDDKLPLLLKERRSGKVMFDQDKAVQEIKRQRLAQSSAIWAKWGEKPCPAFAYYDLDGQLWTEKSIRGKVTLINFWHTDSGPCVRAIPWLNKLCDKHPEANFLACTFNGASQVEEVIAREPFPYPQLTEALSLWQTFGVIISPTTIILDKQGNVFAIITGLGDRLKREIESKMREALHE